MEGKQTASQIALSSNCSVATIKRRLKDVTVKWEQPEIKGCGVIHLDATYFGRNVGVMTALEAGTGRVLYVSHIAHERVSDYVTAVESIESRGYVVTGIVVDGMQKLFKTFSDRKLQMCQFHMVAIIRRKLTKNPQLAAGVELLALVYGMKSLGSSDFKTQFEGWKNKWDTFLKERTVNHITGKSTYTHQRLRSAVLSLEYYLPWLFTFEETEGMPRTNNPLEGTFTDLKKKLAVHPGMSEENRKRFVDGFFLAYKEKHNKEGGRS